jgi:hypothetical protein
MLAIGSEGSDITRCCATRKKSLLSRYAGSNENFVRLVEPEWAEWYRLSPVERWSKSEKLWQTYLGSAQE